MGIFNHETPEQKQSRLEHNQKVKAIYLEAKRKEQIAEAKRAGKLAGAKGKRTFMDKLGDAGKSLNNSVAVMEGALGGVPTQQVSTAKSKKEQPRIVYVTRDTKQPPKKKTLSINEQLFGDRM